MARPLRVLTTTDDIADRWFGGRDEDEPDPYAEHAETCRCRDCDPEWWADDYC